MFRIGSHISSAKGYLAMGKEAARIGATSFQFFLRNPRGGRAKALDHDDIARFLAFVKEHDIGPLVAHASYVLNPAATDRLKTFVHDTIADDFARLEFTPGNMYNIHPGHAKGQSIDDAVKTVAATLDGVMTPGLRSTVLLETMSGGGNEIGGRFEELRAIIDASTNGKRLGVCIDTCHVFDAGYDIVNDLDVVLKHFDKVVGLDRLKAIHLNDSKNALGSHRDRHAKLGEGEIGLEAFGGIINHPALRELPFILETPNDADGYAREIAVLKSMYKEKKPVRSAKPVKLKTAKPAAASPSPKEKAVAGKTAAKTTARKGKK